MYLQKLTFVHIAHNLSLSILFKDQQILHVEKYRIFVNQLNDSNLFSSSVTCILDVPYIKEYLEPFCFAKHKFNTHFCNENYTHIYITSFWNLLSETEVIRNMLLKSNCQVRFCSQNLDSKQMHVEGCGVFI